MAETLYLSRLSEPSAYLFHRGRGGRNGFGLALRVIFSFFDLIQIPKGGKRKRSGYS